MKITITISESILRHRAIIRYETTHDACEQQAFDEANNSIKEAIDKAKDRIEKAYTKQAGL